MAFPIGWCKRRSHVINTAVGAGTNYQKKVVIHFGAGVDVGEDVFLNGVCRNDFGDIRFTDNDGITELDYWMDPTSYVVGNKADFWVEVRDDLGAGNQTIYIYYANAVATTTSNGPNTFIYFQDFNNLVNGDLNGQDGWTADPTVDVQVGTVKEGAKALQIGVTALEEGEHAVVVDGEKCFLQLYLRTAVIATNGYPAVMYLMEGANPISAVCLRQNQKHHLRAAGWENIEAGAANTWYKVKLALDSKTTHKVWIDDVEKVLGFYSNFNNVVTSVNTIRLEHFSENCLGYFDQVIVGKYVDPEPAHGAWGAEETLVPTVVTNAGTCISSTSATLSGNITAIGGGNATTRGFRWGVISGVYPNSWSEAGSFGTGVFTHNITVVCGTTYFYQAFATNPCGTTYGAEQSFTCQTCAPTNLTGVCVGATRIDLTWTDNATDEVNYFVERNDGGWHVISGALPPNTNAYSDLTVVCGTPYLYRVHCFSIYFSPYNTLGAAITCTCITPTPPIVGELVKGKPPKPWVFEYFWYHIPFEKVRALVSRFNFGETKTVKSALTKTFQETKSIRSKIANKFSETLLVGSNLIIRFIESELINSGIIKSFEESRQIKSMIYYEFIFTANAKIIGKTKTIEDKIEEDLEWI